MIRIVRTPEDGIQIDPTGKHPGRGAYLHSQNTCWERAMSYEGMIAHALRTQLTDADRRRLSHFAAILAGSGKEVKHD